MSIKIKAKPVDGAANEGVIKFLAKELGDQGQQDKNKLGLYFQNQIPRDRF